MPQARRSFRSLFLAQLRARPIEQQYVLVGDLVIAHLAGFGDDFETIIRERVARVTDGRILVEAVGSLDGDGLSALATTLRTGDAVAIRDLIGQLRSAVAPPLWEEWGVYESIAFPLLAAGRADLLATLVSEEAAQIGRPLDRIYIAHAARMAATIGAVSATATLVELGTTSAEFGLPTSQVDDVMRHIYLHGGVSPTIGRRLIAALRRAPDIKFGSPALFEAAIRTWAIRSGIDEATLPSASADVDLDTIEPLLAFRAERESESGRRVEAAILRRKAEATPPLEMLVPQRGLAFHFDIGAKAVLEAKAWAAARRTDMDAALALAATKAGALIDPAMIVIVAFLAEGDWRNAAQVAACHSPLDRSYIPGFDDTRLADAVAVQVALMAHAIRAGDFAAAREFFEAAERLRGRRRRIGSGPTTGMWLTAFEEGLLPRDRVGLFLPLFPLAA